MAKDRGILIHSDGSLQVQVVRDGTGKITSGLVVGDSLMQNQYMILKAQKGDIKEYPGTGVGIDDIMGDDRPVSEWKKLIRDELEKDGMRLKQADINMQTGEIHLDAKYR